MTIPHIDCYFSMTYEQLALASVTSEALTIDTHGQTFRIMSRLLLAASQERERREAGRRMIVYYCYNVT